MARTPITFAHLGVILIVTLAIVGGVVSPTIAADDIIPANQVRLATERGLKLLIKSGRNWQKNKTCFTCHHQTLPMLAIREATEAGFVIEPDVLPKQGEFTLDFLHDRVDLMQRNRNLPGGSATAEFALWALMLDKRPADATTTATVDYLIRMQGISRLDGKPSTKPIAEPGRWLPTCIRPPLNSSLVGGTILALMTMKHYATTEQQPAVEKATKLAETWLAKAPLPETEDRIWRLWGLHQFGSDPAKIQSLRADLIADQHADGGWSQTKSMASDAYATGQALYVLRQMGLPANDPIANRAVAFLVKTQHADGSWFVESRAKFKAQPDFDNGDPHGKNQFIAISATSWATAALIQMRSEK